MPERTAPSETPTTTTPINHVALWSMITGLAGLTVGWTIPLPWSLAAVILGHIGLSQVKGERGNNRGFAVAGLVTGYIGIGLVLLLIALVAFVVAAFGFDEIMQFIRMMTFDSAPFDMSRELPEGWSAP
jgi:hypothetical protein